MYTRRIADEELEERLGAAGAVLIEGPRACGKTETARQRAASEVLLDVDEYARQAMAIDPALVLAGDRPRLIDEWQIEPAIWNHVRREVDRSRGPGRFIWGDWCAFEVKLGAGQVDAAAASLSKFRERVDLVAAGEPKMLGVITSSGYGYVRSDGIAVIPIGALAP